MAAGDALEERTIFQTMLCLKVMLLDVPFVNNFVSTEPSHFLNDSTFKHASAK